MNSKEPRIRVGIFEHNCDVHGTFNGSFAISTQRALAGEFQARAEAGTVVMTDKEGRELLRANEIVCQSRGGATFTLRQVTIGLAFHWERKEAQTFKGDLTLLAREDDTISAINDILLEDYLASVVSSEMSADAPIELLKAHAITSRSWLAAMLERQRRVKHTSTAAHSVSPGADEFIRWYDRADHDCFDVCADDHCQRYQGISKIISDTVAQAINATRGVVLVHNGVVCDARFYKACGGLTDSFESAWEDTPVPYLQSVSDAAQTFPMVMSEEDAERWISSAPEAYCNTADRTILRRVLPSFDQETMDFFRWSVSYTREELEDIIRAKSGVDVGTLMNLVPVQRGPSGRLVKLKIEGTKKTLVIGKELEIRRWLSQSHLYSSAFVVKVQRDEQGIPVRLTLAGAGWGHGVGLCQIGAAVMAMKGFKAEEIVKHYFHGTQLHKLY